MRKDSAPEIITTLNNEELRSLWTQGLMSGLGTMQSIEIIKREGRRRFAKNTKKE